MSCQYCQGELDTGFKCVKCGKETLPDWVKRNRKLP